MKYGIWHMAYAPALNLKSQISNRKYPPCDLCGSTGADLVLTTPRLDGPLVRCRDCGLYFVVLPEKDLAEKDLAEKDLAERKSPEGEPRRNQDQESSSQQVGSEMVRLAERARELALIDPEVEAGERPWRELTARERLDDLKRFVTKGRFVEIGCSTGEMLAAAGSSFTAMGVEADERASRAAVMRGLDVFNGTLCDARLPEEHFDAAAMYHVIEHVPSPRQELRELHRIIKPDGWLILETPNIATVWFRLLGARWRQFIPDHIFFFTPRTITRLCEESGFETRELRSVGKVMSVRLFINRLSRYHRPTANMLEAVSARLNLSDLTIRLKLGDVMRLYAKRL
ncbi:MAG: class I SAM-dependent methyltransferase [Blastocatellia bacterium]